MASALKKFMQRKQQRDWAAIAPSDRGWYLVRISQRQKKPQLVAFEELGYDDLTQLRLLGREHITTLLDSNGYRLLQIDTPKVAPDELRTAVKWRVKEMLDDAVDDVTIDVLDIPVGEKAARPATLLVVAARNDAIYARVKAFRSANAPLDVIDIPELALRNVAALYERDGQAVVLAWLDDRQGLLLIVHHGELYMWRTLEGARGYDAGGIDRDSQIERSMREIRRTLDHFDRHFSDVPLGHMVLMAGQDMTELASEFAGYLDLPIEVAQPEEQIAGLAELVPDRAQQIALMPLIGAALRITERAR